MQAPPDPQRCPLCQRPNACGMAQGLASCWCQSVKIPADVLERVPPEARDKVCVCEACASEQAVRGRPLRVAARD